MRVLVAEDEPRVAAAVARGLRREGMAVDVASDGASALYKARVNPYDVVVLDRDLPELHGDDVCRELTAEQPATKVLMLTAARSTDALVEGLALGADDYLPKPFRFRLGSPAPAFGADTPGGWLDRFMTGARERGYRVDFIALHWYGSDFGPAAVDHLRGYLEATYRRYRKPIWLTEYALMSFSGGRKYPTADQQTAFVRASTSMLEDLPYVERYAWFALPSERAGDTGLYRDGTTPTAAGTAYRAAGPDG
jgi:CheY-like chemotaxis protein